MKNLKKIAMSLAALGMVIGTVTLMSFSKKTAITSQSAITLSFIGDSQNQTDVEDPSLWVEQEFTPNCSGDDKACSMTVNPTDTKGTTGSRELDPAKITLNANPGASGYYVPTKSSSSSSTNPIVVHNQDL